MPFDAKKCQRVNQKDFATEFGHEFMTKNTQKTRYETYTSIMRLYGFHRKFYGSLE